jgi:hypothetical protein
LRDPFDFLLDVAWLLIDSPTPPGSSAWAFVLICPRSECQRISAHLLAFETTSATCAAHSTHRAAGDGSVLGLHSIVERLALCGWNSVPRHQVPQDQMCSYSPEEEHALVYPDAAGDRLSLRSSSIPAMVVFESFNRSVHMTAFRVTSCHQGRHMLLRTSMWLIGNQLVIVRCSILLRGSGSPAYDHRVPGADHTMESRCWWWLLAYVRPTLFISPIPSYRWILIDMVCAARRREQFACGGLWDAT